MTIERVKKKCHSEQRENLGTQTNASEIFHFVQNDIYSKTLIL